MIANVLVTLCLAFAACACRVRLASEKLRDSAYGEHFKTKKASRYFSSKELQQPNLDGQTAVSHPEKELTNLLLAHTNTAAAWHLNSHYICAVRCHPGRTTKGHQAVIAMQKTNDEMKVAIDGSVLDEFSPEALTAAQADELNEITEAESAFTDEGAQEVVSAQLGESDAIFLCREWIRRHVIRLGLCPFASKPFTEERIRYAVSDAKTEEDLVEDFFREGELLLEADPEEIATTMLIAPNYLDGIEEFFDLYEWLRDVLESGDEPILNNRVQPAFFHPKWTFTGLPDESPLHFEKRAPVVVINLLRRADLDSTVQSHLERGIIINKEIGDHNAAALEAEGFEKLSHVFRSSLARSI